MKKIFTITFMLLSVLIFSGCASSPWRGIDPNARVEWKSIGVSASTAHVFQRNGFTPFDVKPWMQQGISSPNVIIPWKRAGIGAREASKWIDKNFTLKEAIGYKKKGLSIGQLKPKVAHA